MNDSTPAKTDEKIKPKKPNTATILILSLMLGTLSFYLIAFTVFLTFKVE
jgi:LPS O-antigen subunit length determinant protein (WzzB/FepE family)